MANSASYNFLGYAELFLLLAIAFGIAVAIAGLYHLISRRLK